MSRRVVFPTLVAALVLSGPSVRAEENSPFRTAVSITGGLSVGSLGRPSGFGGLADRFGIGRYDSESGLAVGGSVARDLTPRLTLEANGSYLDRQAGGWSADAGVRLNLLPSSRAIVPYFAVSGGVLNRSSQIDVSGLKETGARAVGALDEYLPQLGRLFPAFGGFSGQAVPAITAALQQFPDVVSGGSSTSGMLTLGGGVRFDAGPHVFVRPDVRAQVVFTNNTRVLGLFTLNFGYRF